MPRCACSNLPVWRWAAPVKEPFSWPKSSLSISSAGTAAQLSVTKGPAARGLFSMQGAGDEFLAGAGFAIDADARLAGGDALDLRHDAAHGFAGPDQRVLADA